MNTTVQLARWAVVQAVVAKLKAENAEELARLKDELASRCREYNKLTRPNTHEAIA